MSYEKFFRQEMKELGWCPGCGLHSIFRDICDVFNGINEEIVVISGIGCTGRAAGYFNLDSIHGLHGRAIPLAVGIKMANPELKVVVISGDGDLLGIGMNHLIHSARRNDNITVICNYNEVFAMTGGQVSPTTKEDAITLTTPKGNLYQPIIIQGILLSNKKHFYGRTSYVFREHLKKTLKEALNHKGFSFVEIYSPCIINYSNKIGKSAADVFKEINKEYKITENNHPLKDNELGIIKNE